MRERERERKSERKRESTVFSIRGMQSLSAKNLFAAAKASLMGPSQLGSEGNRHPSSFRHHPPSYSYNRDLYVYHIYSTIHPTIHPSYYYFLPWCRTGFSTKHHGSYLALWPSLSALIMRILKKNNVGVVYIGGLLHRFSFLSVSLLLYSSNNICHV